MQKQLGNELQNYENLGNIAYIIKYEGKEGDIKYSYICDAEATLIGVTPKWDNVRREMGWYCTTFFYTTPSDIIYQLKRGKYKVDHG